MVGRCEGKVSFSQVRWEIHCNYKTDDEPGIRRAAVQYGVESRIVDLCTYDVTKNPLRCGELFDAILTDPPCKFGNKILGRLIIYLSCF